MVVHKLGDMFFPLLLGIIAGVLKLLLTGSGKTKTQMLRSLLISIICGVLAGWWVEGWVVAEGMKALTISLSAIVSGDLVEGIIKLSNSFKNNPKRMLEYIIDLRLKFFK
jgi:hypothetical protein